MLKEVGGHANHFLCKLIDVWKERKLLSQSHPISTNRRHSRDEIALTQANFTLTFFLRAGWMRMITVLKKGNKQDLKQLFSTVGFTWSFRDVVKVGRLKSCRPVQQTSDGKHDGLQSFCIRLVFEELLNFWIQETFHVGLNLLFLCSKDAGEMSWSASCDFHCDFTVDFY